MSSVDKFFYDSGYHRLFSELIDEHLDEAERKECEKTGLILLKPDAIAGGKANEIVKRIEGAELILIEAFLIAAPKESQFEELYKFNLTLKNSHNQIGSWWLNRQVYTSGPSLLLLVQDSINPTLDIFTKITDLKGASNPYLSNEGQIRRDCFGTNMALNLIHTSDDLLSLTREFLIFSDMNHFKKILQRTSRYEKRERRFEIHKSLCSKVEFLMKVVATEKVDTNTFRIALRQATKVLFVRGRMGKEREECIHARISAILRNIEELDAKKNISLMYESYEIIHKKLGDDSRWMDDLSLIHTILSIDKWSDSTAEIILSGLASRGITPSKWERLVIVSSAHYASTFGI